MGGNVLRELMIRFREEGGMFREIDGERNYFFSEAEEIVKQIRERLRKEKRESPPKSFELWLDSKKLVVTYVSFERKESLEEQLQETMLKHGAWEEEKRHKYINQFKSYAEKERQLLVSPEFKAFAIRFDELLGHKHTTPVPLILSLKQIHKLFLEVYPHVTSGFYSELEDVVLSIKRSYQAVAHNKVGHGADQALMEEWFSKQENLNCFIQYVAAAYQSVSENRLRALLPRFKLYQEYENYLFQEVAKVMGFEWAFTQHLNVMESMYEKYHAILFEGFVLKNDDMVQSLVLYPVMQEVKAKMQEEVKADEQTSANHLS